MVSEGGVFRGDMPQRASRSMTFGQFLDSAKAEGMPSADDSAPAMQLYLAQVRSRLVDLFVCFDYF